MCLKVEMKGMVKNTPNKEDDNFLAKFIISSFFISECIDRIVVLKYSSVISEILL